MNVFTYGSLMFSSVINELTGKILTSEDAVLENYERLAISGKKYPGIRYKVGSKVEGKVWFDVDNISMEMLDRFEDSLYEKREIQVDARLKGNVGAFAYVISLSNEHLLSGEWNVDIFDKLHLEAYVEMCRRFRFENLK